MKYRTRSNKFNNTRVALDGINFDSILESKTYLFLKGFVANKNDLELYIKPRYELFNLKGRSYCYVPDFGLKDKKENRAVVLDSKGFQTPFFKWKEKHFNSVYPNLPLLKGTLEKIIHSVNEWYNI